MDYIKYSLIALVCWGFWAIGSKLMTRYFNTVSTAFWISFWSIVVLSAFLFLRKNLMVKSRIFYAVPIGIVSLIAILAFYKALKQGPVSVVMPITNMYILIPVLYGFIVLGEAITVPRILGIICAIVATILLSL